jgi:hypothetical protein
MTISAKASDLGSIEGNSDEVRAIRQGGYATVAEQVLQGQ